MHKNSSPTHFRKVVHKLLSCFLIPCVIGAFPDRPSEDFREIRPIPDIVPFKDNPECGDGKVAYLTWLADVKKIVEVIPTLSGYVALMVKDHPIDGIEVLARNERVVNPSTLVPVELEEGPSDSFPFVVVQVSEKLEEPWGLDVLLHCLIQLAVPHELDRCRENCGLLFPQYGEQVAVKLHVLIQVTKLFLARVVNDFRRAYSAHIDTYVKPSTSCLLKDDGRCLDIADMSAGGYSSFLVLCHIRNDLFFSCRFSSETRTSQRCRLPESCQAPRW